MLVWRNDKATVEGYERVYDTSTASRGLLDLEDGDEIEFIGDFYTYEGELQEQYIFDSITVDGALEVTYEDVGENDCLIYYSLHDIYQNVYWTESLTYSMQ